LKFLKIGLPYLVSQNEIEPSTQFFTYVSQIWGDYSTNVIDYDYLPPTRLRMIMITM